MDFDEDMSGLQIEDLGEYFLQTDTNDNWKGFSLGYTDEEQQQQQNSKRTAGSHNFENSSSLDAEENFMQQSTSPLLSSISEMMKLGNGLEIGTSSDSKDFAALLLTGLTPARIKSDVAVMEQTTKDIAELANFSLGQCENTMALKMPGLVPAKKATPLGCNTKSTPKLLRPQCQNNLSSDDDDLCTFGGVDLSKRGFDFMTVSCNPSGCSTIGSKSSISMSSPTPEDDRGFRKKSREKMRRQEVNVKFEELVDLLGLSNRVRKSVILHEAVSAIKTLRRERNELRRDRDRLQQEATKLATCLQYSHLGSVAAANAVAMTQQPNQQFSHMNPSAQHFDPQHDRQAAAAIANGLQAVHTHQLNALYNQGTCFPLCSAFSSVSSQLGSHSSSATSAASATSASGQVTIAPKPLSPAPSSSPYAPIAPDTEMK